MKHLVRNNELQVIKFVGMPLALAVFLISGCTTLGSMEKHPNEGGLAQSYNASYKQMFDLALYACQVLDFDVESNSYDQKYIVASNGMSGFSYGERIGVYFTEKSSDETYVRVVTRAKVKTNFLAPRWASEVHQVMQNRLNQLNETKPSS